jgi:hypothetical protein
MIKDNQYFLDSIQKELTNRGYKYSHGFIDCYDKENISRHLTLFDKPKEFKYQKEFRFYVENDKIEPIKIQTGICTTMPKL